jgi:hypothetical protein
MLHPDVVISLLQVKSNGCKTLGGTSEELDDEAKNYDESMLPFNLRNLSKFLVHNIHSVSRAFSVARSESGMY